MACVVETGIAAQVAASMKNAPAASAHVMPAASCADVMHHAAHIVFHIQIIVSATCIRTVLWSGSDHAAGAVFSSKGSCQWQAVWALCACLTMQRAAATASAPLHMITHYTAKQMHGPAITERAQHHT